jgi:NADPH:quinone reductase-like Zn-dependent oxidoreductase
MKAIVYTKKGSPELLQLREIEKPSPNENEVLVKIVAVSANAADYRSMKMGLIPKKRIFGADIAGIVESVGKDCTQFNPGDEVIGDLSNCGFGGFAEYAVAPEKVLLKKPSGLSFEDAAALPMAGITALQALQKKGQLKAGEKVLIVGSGGGVGTFAVQLARYFEAEVAAVCSTRNVEQSLSLGANYVIDYTRQEFTHNKNCYDIILAINGSQTLATYKRMLKKGGRYIMVGGSLSQIFSSLMFGWFFSFGSKKMGSLAAKSNSNDLTFIVKLAGEGKIKPVIERVYPLEKTPEAIEYLSRGHASGKIVITL